MDDRAEPGGTRRTLAELLAAAEARITRVSAADAHVAMGAGARLIDIRGDHERERDGVVPGALHVPRTVLEWRFDLDSPLRTPHVRGRGERLLLLCDHGCSSVLAAASLVELGFTDVGDVIGGFEAWRAAGLPVGAVPPSTRRADEPAGLGPPDA